MQRCRELIECRSFGTFHIQIENCWKDWCWISSECDLLGVVIVWENLDHFVLIHLRVICDFLFPTFDLSQALWSQIYCRWGGKGRGDGGLRRGWTFSFECFLWFSGFLKRFSNSIFSKCLRQTIKQKKPSCLPSKMCWRLHTAINESTRFYFVYTRKIKKKTTANPCITTTWYVCIGLKDKDLKNLKPNTMFLEGEKEQEDNWVVNVEDSLQRAQGLLN